jgi:hypothetical protein
MQYLKVKNWEEFQQYKDRSPKWIKLHRDLLRDYDFGKLPDAQKACLLMIWLLAAETDNKIPNDADWIMRQAQLKTKPDIKQLVAIGFLMPYNSVQDCTNPYLETETEAYRKEKEYTSEFLRFWDLYPRKDGSKATAFKSYNQALKETNHEALIGSLERFNEYNRAKGTEPQYIAHAATWLNQKRWEADYAAKSAGGGMTKEQINDRLGKFL